ncbi:hypothetical protein [Euzebya sp.]|uniref:hypothetical protein n=1 Tax=Euzebya sp. TaxID=1971409 RepID=UPI003515EDD0
MVEKTVVDHLGDIEDRVHHLHDGIAGGLDGPDALTQLATLRHMVDAIGRDLAGRHLQARLEQAADGSPEDLQLFRSHIHQVCERVMRM